MAPRVTELKGQGGFADFAELPGEGEPKWHENPRCKMMSFNAYFGAFPIADALSKGAQIVVTGILVRELLLKIQSNLVPQGGVRTVHWCSAH